MNAFSGQWRWHLVIFATVALLTLHVIQRSSCQDGELQQQRQQHQLPDGAGLPKIFNYELYRDKYHSSALGQSPVRFLARVRLFIARTLQIFKHNALYATRAAGHYLKQNMFTDMPAGHIIEHFVSQNDGLSLVAEARLNPDMPAENFLKQHEAAHNDYDSDEINDGYSQADLSSLGKEAASGKPGDLQQRLRLGGSRTGGLDFLEEPSLEVDEESLSLAEVMKKLDQRAARKVARLSASAGRTTEFKMVEEQVRRADKARKSNGIVHAPLVEPTNVDYDPSLLHSKGLVSSGLDYFTGGAFSQSLDDEPRNREQADELNKSLLSSLVGKLGDYLFDHEMFEGDDSDDEFEDARDSFATPSLDGDLENDDDFKEARDGLPQSPSPKPGSGARATHEPGPIVYDVDWRQTGCVSRPKHQLDCNSCYAFATLDLMEFFHCRQKKSYTEFSVQYIVDCGHVTKLNGCRGGKVTNVGLFIRNHGIQLNALYPYQAREGQCPFDDEASGRGSYALKPMITGWKMFDEISAWQKWLPKTPLIVGINMPSDFLAYGGGIHDGLDCVEAMGHAMLLVGSGKQDGKPFWLLKNSFSKDWGEAGYFRLSKRAPLRCFKSAIVARANFNIELGHK